MGLDGERLIAQGVAGKAEARAAGEEAILRIALQQFLPLAEWVEGQEQHRAPRPDGNVYALARAQR